jgi:hypothetical protein
MPKAKDVNNLLNELHERKIVNLDQSLKSVLQPSAQLDSLDPGAEVSAAIIAWDGYALVIKTKMASIEEVAALGQGIRQQLISARRPTEGGGGD